MIQWVSQCQITDCNIHNTSRNEIGESEIEGSSIARQIVQFSWDTDSWYWCYKRNILSYLWNYEKLCPLRAKQQAENCLSVRLLLPVCNDIFRKIFQWVSHFQRELIEFKFPNTCVTFCTRFWCGSTQFDLVEYAVEYEHKGFRSIAGYGVALTRGAAGAMSFTFSLLLLTMCR